MKLTALTTAAVLTGGLSLAGCANSNSPFASNEGQRAQLAASAATSQYPQDAEAQDIKATAIVEGSTLVVANQTNSPLHDVKVWLNNGSYVTQLGMIPAHGRVEIPLDTFYTTGTSAKTYADYNQRIFNVELQAGETLYRLSDPVYGGN